MKKYLGAIISAAIGILTFVFLSIPNFVMKMAVEGETQRETMSAWELFKGENAESFEMMGVNAGFAKFAVIALAIVAGLLIVSAVLMLLKNLSVLKLNLNLNMINNIVLAVYALVAVLALIAFFVLGADMKAVMGEEVIAMIEAMGGSVYIGPAAGAWINASVGVVGCAAGWLFARKAD